MENGEKSLSAAQKRGQAARGERRVLLVRDRGAQPLGARALLPSGETSLANGATVAAPGTRVSPLPARRSSSPHSGEDERYGFGPCEKGAASGPTPQALFGRLPSSRVTVPPLTITSWLIQVLSLGLPLTLTD